MANVTGKKQLTAIVGPTAVGKSELAVEIALDHNGEIVSADSRQVYRGLDIGTGKITDEEKRGVRHHCLDIADPSYQLTVAEYKQCADNAITDIQSRDKLPILVGGTGFYVQAVVDDIDFPEVPPDHELREQLGQKSTEELYKELQEKDPDRAATIEPDNKRRLVRALEIVHYRGKVPQLESSTSPYDLLMIGLYVSREELRERISARLTKRIDEGMIEEAARLHDNGLSYERMIELGLEYRYLAYYLRGELSKKDMKAQLETAIYQFATKQLSWFRHDERIEWFNPQETDQITKRLAAFCQ